MKNCNSQDNDLEIKKKIVEVDSAFITDILRHATYLFGCSFHIEESKVQKVYTENKISLMSYIPLQKHFEFLHLIYVILDLRDLALEIRNRISGI